MVSVLVAEQFLKQDGVKEGGSQPTDASSLFIISGLPSIVCKSPKARDEHTKAFCFPFANLLVSF